MHEPYMRENDHTSVYMGQPPQLINRNRENQFELWEVWLVFEGWGLVVVEERVGLGCGFGHVLMASEHFEKCWWWLLWWTSCSQQTQMDGQFLLFFFPQNFSRDSCDSFLCSFFFWKLIVKWRWCMVHVQYTTNSFNSMLIMLINLTFLFVWCGPWSVITNHY